jgi:ubiquinone/menaquinone biosynthesis C-methylase UbiE
MQKKKTTSWEGVSRWYNQSVGETGHYYHEHVIIPKLLALLKLEENPKSSVLDLACGQGILSRQLPSSFQYVGIDISPSLLKAAQEKNKLPHHSFLLSDITKPLPLNKKDFDICTVILALQNIKEPFQALKQAHSHLKTGGKLFLVMNHPCFRILRQSSWGVDPVQKVQYRRIDKYKSSFEVRIQSNPSLGSKSKDTLSFHHPLSQWSSWLKKAGFAISQLDEWCSDKKSTGKHAKMEDTSREEIPLFLLVEAVKL